MAKRSPSLDTDNTPNDREELARLKAEMADMQGRLSTAESVAAEERGRRVKAEESTMSEAERHLRTQLSASETLITNLDSEADGLEERIAQLSDEPGHGKEIAKMSRRLSEIAADKRAESDKKNWLAGNIEKVKGERTTRAAAPATRQTLADGTLLSDIPPASAEWARRHPKMMNDPAYMRRVVAAAGYAENLKGLKVGTPEYYAEIEDQIGEGHQSQRDDREGDDLDTSRQTEQRRASPYSTTKEQGGDLDYNVEKSQQRAAGGGTSTPPSRRVPDGSNRDSGNRRQPMLSSEEREVADSLYSHIPNEADRYVKYSDNKARVAERVRAGHMMTN